MKLSIDESCLLLAARYLRKQIKQLSGQIEGIRKAEDIEFVHRARVASRRLRVALDLFAEWLPADRLKAWQKEIRRVGRGLGEARDLDVQIEFLRGKLSNLENSACTPGVARVFTRARKKREEFQPKVLKAMNRLLSNRALHEMLGATKKMLPADKKSEGAAPSAALFEHAEKHILARFDELYAFRACLAEPGNQQQHHAMRIAAKRLRYTMEICRPIYGGQLDEATNVVKQLQTYLGEIHDCDVWTANLGAWLEKQSKRIRILYGHLGPLSELKTGVDCLEQDRRRAREQNFSELVRYWEELDRAAFWDKLTQAVRNRGATPPAPVKENITTAESQEANLSRPVEPVESSVSSESAAALPANGEVASSPKNEPCLAVSLSASAEGDVG